MVLKSWKIRAMKISHLGWAPLRSDWIFLTVVYREEVPDPTSLFPNLFLYVPVVIKGAQKHFWASGPDFADAYTVTQWHINLLNIPLPTLQRPCHILIVTVFFCIHQPLPCSLTSRKEHSLYCKRNCTCATIRMVLHQWFSMAALLQLREGGLCKEYL